MIDFDSKRHSRMDYHKFQSFYSRPCTNPSGYNLGCRRRCSMLDSSLIFKIPRLVFKEFSMVQSFVAPLVPELFTHLLENSQRGQTIVGRKKPAASWKLPQC